MLKALETGGRGAVWLAAMLLFLGGVSLGAVSCEIMGREAWIGAALGAYIGFCWCLALHLVFRADASFLSANEVGTLGHALPERYLIRPQAPAG